ncbi:MAG: voltage-gated chloride channel [Acidimicrobiia bacterium]|nr:voltage-gated chloride channel [Acidimicrobiia bacterium]
MANDAFHIKPWRARLRREGHEQVALGLHLVRWIVLGALSGVLAGLSSWIFLEGLDRVTTFRGHHPWLLYLLPAAGLVVGAAYH